MSPPLVWRATPPRCSTVRATIRYLPVAPGPGGIGRIRAIGSDAIRLSVGDWVYCDPTVRARDDGSNGAAILQGWTYRSEAARPLHRLYHQFTLGDVNKALAHAAANAGPAGLTVLRPDHV